MESKKEDKPGGYACRRPSGHASHCETLYRLYPRSTSSTSGTPVYLKTPQGQRIAGYIKQIGTIIAFVMTGAAATLQRNMDSYGIDVRVLNELKRRGIEHIRVVSDYNKTYDTTISAYYRYGISYDFGYGAQLFLPRSYFNSSGGVV